MTDTSKVPARKRRPVDVFVGNKVKNERKASRLSQAELAKMVGLTSDQIISLIETGTRRLQIEEAIKLSKLFYCDFIALYGECLGSEKPDDWFFKSKIRERTNRFKENAKRCSNRRLADRLLNFIDENDDRRHAYMAEALARLLDKGRRRK